MGAVASSIPLTRYFHPDTIASVSPWQTCVTIDNQTDGPVLVHLAASSAKPDPVDAVAKVLPAQEESGITSGWYHEPRATLLIRTGLEEAKIVRAPTGARIIVKLREKGKGLQLEVPADVEIADFDAPATVAGLDTVAMCFRGVSFEDVQSAKRSADDADPDAHPAVQAEAEDKDCAVPASIVGLAAEQP